MMKRSFSLRALASLPALLGLVVAHTADAQMTFSRTQPFGSTNVLNYSNTTVGGPTWRRTLTGNPPTGTSGTGTNVAYQVQSFVAANTGTHNFLSLGTTPANWDNFLVLYRNSFDPTTQLTNVIVANDDFTTIGRAGFNNVNLVSGTTYFLVTTGFGNSDAGAFTNTVDFANDERSVPDNNTTGRDSTINVGSHGSIAAFNSITIEGLTHTFIGDLTATLSHGGVTVELFDRVGRTTTTGFGSGGNLGGSYTFVEGGPALPLTGDVAAGTYGRFTNGTEGESLTFLSSFNDFKGLDIYGDWTLNITDRASGDLGSFTGWRFSVTAVPEPGTYALLAAMAIPGALLLRRRRK